jgi:glycosyltransferase involved in cell wall biosynthesis
MRALDSSYGRPRVVMLLENNPYPQDVRVRGEAEALAAAGYAVEVIAPCARGQPLSEQVGAVAVRRFRAFRPQTLSVTGFLHEYLVALSALHFHALRALLRGASVLHLHNPPDLLFPAGALYRLVGRRVVFDHHDLFPEMVRVKTTSRPWGAAARIAERLTYAVADHVLATNASYAEIAHLRGKKRPHEVTIVRNAPPDSWLERPLRRRGKAPSDGLLHLGYLGELSDHDGVDSLIPLLVRIRKRGVDPHLTIIGDGDARPRLEQAVKREGIADRVTFTGWMNHDAVPEMLERVDVCIDPAPASEYNVRSTMTKIAEYLSVGQPIVAYDLTETRRTAGDAAVLVQPGDEAGFADAVVALARDPWARGQRSALARERARSLSWSHSERALLDAYRRTIRESPIPSSLGKNGQQPHDDRRPAQVEAHGSNGMTRRRARGLAPRAIR